jgi:hypothetical protein
MNGAGIPAVDNDSLTPQFWNRGWPHRRKWSAQGRLRATSSSLPPYEGLYVTDFRNHVALPVFREMSNETQLAMVDGVLLKTAAFTSLFDPLISIDGRTYSTTSANTGERLEGGADNDGDDGESRALACAVASDGWRFEKMFAGELALLFVTGGGEALAVESVVARSPALSGIVNRHAQ